MSSTNTLQKLHSHYIYSFTNFNNEQTVSSDYINYLYYKIQYVQCRHSLQGYSLQVSLDFSSVASFKAMYKNYIILFTIIIQVYFKHISFILQNSL